MGCVGPGQSFAPVAVGDVIGPSWSTHWYKVHISIPDTGMEAVLFPEILRVDSPRVCSGAFSGHEVHFLWDSGCEACIFSSEGIPLQVIGFPAMRCQRTVKYWLVFMQGLTGGSGDDKRHEYKLLSHAKG
jgi:hypothetical protein